MRGNDASGRSPPPSLRHFGRKHASRSNSANMMATGVIYIVVGLYSTANFLKNPITTRINPNSMWHEQERWILQREAVRMSAATKYQSMIRVLSLKRLRHFVQRRLGANERNAESVHSGGGGCSVRVGNGNESGWRHNNWLGTFKVLGSAALLSTSLPTRSPSPSRRVQKGHVDVTVPRPRARFSPLWLPSFYVVAAGDALPHRHSNTGFRRVVGRMQYGLEHRSLALTDEPADAVPPTGIAAFDLYRHDYGLLDLKLAASTST
ncbi:hypothetical protein BDZ89DRAFT_1190186, partial [Hymenopellis radicata]